jgi:hypothetical protein
MLVSLAVTAVMLAIIGLGYGLMRYGFRVPKPSFDQSYAAGMAVAMLVVWILVIRNQVD